MHVWPGVQSYPPRCDRRRDAMLPGTHPAAGRRTRMLLNDGTDAATGGAVRGAPRPGEMGIGLRERPLTSAQCHVSHTSAHLVRIEQLSLLDAVQLNCRMQRVFYAPRDSLIDKIFVGDRLNELNGTVRPVHISSHLTDVTLV